MLLPGDNSPKTWFFVTILVSSIIAFSESSGGKTLDFKLGFDLTQGGIGAPSLRIRDFKDSREFNPRALDGESSSEESASEKKIEKPSGEEHPKKEELSKERVKPEKTEEDDGNDDEKNSGSGEDNGIRVTRGPKNGEFEPEEAIESRRGKWKKSPKIHAKYEKNTESDNNSEEDGRRYKRHIERFGNVAKRI